MRWQAVVVVAAATVGGVLPQCLTDYNEVNQNNTDLSGITDFGLDLFRQLSPAASPKNFFFSPYSIWTVFTLAYLGTNGNTKQELESALKLTDKTSTQRLLNDLKLSYQQRANNTDYTFSVANRVYYDNILQMRSCIKDILRDELEELNFKDAIGAAQAINNFASNSTNGLIKKIVASSDLRNIAMLLVNAVYFKGTWINQFDPSNTREEPFYITPNQTKPVNMMYISSKFRYAESQELRADVLDVPYAGDDMSMVLLLPTVEGPQGFEDMVRALNGADLHSVLDTGLKETTVILKLPKFKMDHSVNEMIPALENMGVKDLFDKSRAEITDFAVNAPLYVAKAVQKAFVEVNEEGTEAAAVTAGLIGIRSGTGPRIRFFFCNRPFIFIIQDKVTKNVLFLGAYKTPTS